MRIQQTITEALVNQCSPFICIDPTWNSPAVIVFSGTQNIRDLVLDDLDIKPSRWPNLEHAKGGHVHGGFAKRTNRLLNRMSDFIDEHESFVVGGHSLGGTCAVLSASYLTSQNKSIESVYTFGIPRLATKSFQKYYKSQDLWNRTTNYITPRDPIVTRIPYVYKKVGVDVLLDYDSDDQWSHHDIGTYDELIKSSGQFVPFGN